MGRGQRIGIALAAVIAFAVGMTTLFSLLLGNHPELYGSIPNAEAVSILAALPASLFVRLATITIAFTIVIGMFNLLYIHLRRLMRRQFYSIVLLLSFAFTVYWHVTSGGDPSLLAAAQLPIESSLAAPGVRVAGIWRRGCAAEARRWLGAFVCRRHANNAAGGAAAGRPRAAAPMERLADGGAGQRRRPRHAAGHRPGNGGRWGAGSAWSRPLIPGIAP